MPNSDLTDALRASLEAETSPLAEADPYSLEELWERINGKLVDGLPETISDGELLAVVQRLRAYRLKVAQDIERKAAAGPKSRGVGRPKSVANEIKRKSLEDLLAEDC